MTEYGEYDAELNAYWTGERGGWASAALWREQKYVPLMDAANAERKRRGIQVEGGTSLNNWSGAATFYCKLLGMNLVECDKYFGTKVYPTVKEQSTAPITETKEEALARLPITEAGAQAYIDKAVDPVKVEKLAEELDIPKEAVTERVISLLPIGAYKGTEDVKTEQTLQNELVMLGINKDKPGKVRTIAYGTVAIVFAFILMLWYFLFKGQRA